MSGRKDMSKLPRVVSTRTSGRLDTSRLGSETSFGVVGRTVSTAKDSRLSLSPPSSLDRADAFENVPPLTNKAAAVVLLSAGVKRAV